MPKLIQPCSKLDFSILSEFGLCRSLHACKNVVLPNTRWQYASFQQVNTPPFPVDLLSHKINNWSQVGDQNFNKRKIDNSMSLFMSNIMYLLLIIQITCTPSLMIVVLLRDVFLLGSYASIGNVECVYMPEQIDFQSHYLGILFGYGEQRYQSG